MSEIELKFGEEFCATCKRDFSTSCEEKVALQKKGLETVLECSRQRGNKDLLDYIQTQPEVLNVHISCRKKYTVRCRSLEFDMSSEVACEPAIPNKKLRSQTDSFEWQSHCFLCGKSVAVGPRNSTREKVKTASTIAFRNNVLKHCSVRMDDWAVEVQGRLEFCNDLPAVGAVYHSTCCNRFFSMAKHPCEKVAETGRSVDVAKENSFLNMCSCLENYETARLYSLEELRRTMIDKEGSEAAVYCCKTIQVKLQERYGSDVTFKRDGLRTIVCLRETAYSILSSKWYADKSDDLSDESSRIVEAAAKLIRAEIKKQEYSRSVYPTKDQMSDVGEGKTWLPSLLRLLLQTIVNDDLKQAAIGQCIVQAARPRSVISPILFGLGVELDLKMRSKWLVNHLARLGFSITYDEVVRFKQSAIPSSNEPPPLHSFPTSFTHALNYY
jgi:hypothetical protein